MNINVMIFTLTYGLSTADYGLLRSSAIRINKITKNMPQNLSYNAQMALYSLWHLICKMKLLFCVRKN